tara:strand:- start:57 stop:479 length:423 start_codon:yes stop_codon:yes gene_type:complete
MSSIFFCNFNVKADIWTLEIGSLYSQCKPYQNANFDFEKLSKSDQVKAMLCKTTLIGIANTGYNLCQSLRWYYKSADNKNTKKALNGLSSWYANEMIKNQDQLIIGFNEWAEKNQHNWKKYITGIAFKRDFMAKRYFCNF